MRTHSIVLYSAAELREHHPEAFRRAHEAHCRMVSEDPAWASEIRQSLARALAAIGDDPPRISGARRCMAWLENNILEPLRIPWHGPQRWQVAKYGAGYRPGQIKPCPWTGVCFDEDLLDEMRDLAREGTSPQEWRRTLCDAAERMFDREVEDQCSIGYFIEHADANEYEFDENGGLA